MTACKQENAHAEEPEIERDTTLPDDFLSFYRQFHQDSLYQIAHIRFPIEGMVQGGTGSDSAVTWNAEDWRMHRQPDTDEYWDVDFTMPLKNIIIEHIHSREEGFWMQRRFARQDTTWYLIYYESLRRK